MSEIEENIKQIQRKQDDSMELKRQLKEMEAKKNNFEALYKKNDQLLHDTEAKLEKEINEKQRLEWATKNLNIELKSIKQKLESLEDEKDMLNQRCVKLKEERDNYGNIYIFILKFFIYISESFDTYQAIIITSVSVLYQKMANRFLQDNSKSIPGSR